MWSLWTRRRGLCGLGATFRRDAGPQGLRTPPRACLAGPPSAMLAGFPAVCGLGLMRLRDRVAARNVWLALQLVGAPLRTDRPAPLVHAARELLQACPPHHQRFWKWPFSAHHVGWHLGQAAAGLGTPACPAVSPSLGNILAENHFKCVCCFPGNMKGGWWRGARGSAAVTGTNI